MKTRPRWWALSATLILAEWLEPGAAAQPMGDHFLLEVETIRPPLWSPAPPTTNDKDAAFCGASIEDRSVQGRGDALANVVVWIEPTPETRGTDGVRPGYPSALRLEAKGCQLSPRVQAAQKGSTLLLSGHDPVLHNPHGWRNDRQTVFNITLYDPEIKFRRRLREPGFYRIDCDIHDWMRAYVVLFDHPWFAVSDELGIARILEVPISAKRVVAWHEVFGHQARALRLEAAPTNRVRINFAPLQDKAAPEPP